MALSICLLSAVPVRAEASHRSEMVSQLLFGEYASVLEEGEDFSRIKCLHDGYEGWIQSNQLTPVPEEEFRSTEQYAGPDGITVKINSRPKHLPFGTPIYGETGPTLLFGKHRVEYEGGKTWTAGSKELNEENLKRIAEVYLDVPYLWGGRSLYGIDCSGFVQQSFKMFGISLLRDAWQQAAQGREIGNLDELRPGDLAFFVNEKERITHVGMMYGSNRIIHASGRVRIDTLDEEGILNEDTGKRTHRLFSMRRYF